MCLVVLAYRVVQGFPIVVAANRDELYSRGGEPPQVLARNPLIWGGRDPAASGTWLGVNEYGVVAALTDRPAENPVATRRSRGLLCLDALRQPSARAVESWLAEEVAARDYNSFNLLYADWESAGVAYCGESLRSAAVTPGVHVLTGGVLDDRAEPKIARAWGLLAGFPTAWAAALRRLRQVCADRREGAAEADQICVRGDRAGTLSSSILGVGEGFPRVFSYHHASGPPCEVDYQEVSGLSALTRAAARL
jgi:uncharacterized protein with NRDE domain